jgi:hypothetical protein
MVQIGGAVVGVIYGILELRSRLGVASNAIHGMHQPSNGAGHDVLLLSQHLTVVVEDEHDGAHRVLVGGDLLLPTPGQRLVEQDGERLVRPLEGRHQHDVEGVRNRRIYLFIAGDYSHLKLRLL